MASTSATIDPGSRLSHQTWAADTQPVVSVFCPAFNQEKFIGPYLDSILAQVVDFPVEIIVHDDASTDGTVAVIQQYAERFPRIIKPILQTENQHSRMRKIRPVMHAQASGIFVAHCDGDDMWLDPHKLTKQVGFLLHNPTFVMSFHDGIKVDSDGRPLGSTTLRQESRRNYSQSELRVLKWGNILMGSTVYRNVTLDFPPEYDLVPNGDIFVPMLLGSFGAAKFQSEVGPLAYRMRPDSVYSSKSPREKVVQNMRTQLLIASYFLRIGEPEAAMQIIHQKLGFTLKRYMDLSR